MRHSVLIFTLILAGCAETSDFVDDFSRDAAKKTVNPVLAEKFPGVPLEPATNCVIDNADTEELFTLAKGAALGPTPETTGVVTEILSRPPTIKCIAEAGLPNLLSNL